MSVDSSIFPLVLLDLSLFLDEILMPRDSPPIMQTAFFSLLYAQVLLANYARCKVWFSSAPIYVPGNALHDVWGTL